MMTTRLKRPVRLRWANHYKKSFKPGDPEVILELPAGTECLDVEHRRIESRLSSTGYLDIVYFTYEVPLPASESTRTKARGVVPKSYVTTE
jgi:hypothetical protein